MGFLEGKVAVVTGGNRGIGRGIAEALAREGATVALTSRNAKAAEQAAREIGGSTLGLPCDVRSYESVQHLFGEVERRAGGTDILVNNAGIGLFAPVAETAPDDWRAVIETNLSGPFYCFSEALMMEVRYDGIRVSYLMPGSVATDFGRGSRDKMGWALRPEDVGEVVL